MTHYHYKSWICFIHSSYLLYFDWQIYIQVWYFQVVEKNDLLNKIENKPAPGLLFLWSLYFLGIIVAKKTTLTLTLTLFLRNISCDFSDFDYVNPFEPFIWSNNQMPYLELNHIGLSEGNLNIIFQILCCPIVLIKIWGSEIGKSEPVFLPPSPTFFAVEWNLYMIGRQMSPSSNQF